MTQQKEGQRRERVEIWERKEKKRRSYKIVEMEKGLREI